MDSFLLLKYLKGSASPKEEAQVRSWLADDPDGSHRATYSQMHNVYNGMTIMGGNSNGGSYSRRTSLRRRIIACSVAASVAALCILGLVRHEKNAAVDRLAARSETIFVPAGKSLMIELEDGSKMWLNGGSEVEKPAVFGRKSRNVTVRAGEVLFDVAKDADRPFFVETFATTVKVLGTRFDVEVDESEQTCSVSLLRGKVSASNPSSDETVELAPDEKVAFVRGRMTKSVIANRSAVDCWTEGLIDVSGQPFDELMRKFEKVYNVSIVIERKDIPKVSYTRGKVRISDGIDHALEVLKMASDFDFEHDFNTNTIFVK